MVELPRASDDRPSVPEGIATDVAHPRRERARVVAKTILKALVPRDLPALGRMIGCLCIGGFAGWVAVPDRPMPMAKPQPLPEVTLDDKPLVLDGTSPQATLDAARAIARDYVHGSIKVGAAGVSRVRTREELGAQI